MTAMIDRRSIGPDETTGARPGPGAQLAPVRRALLADAHVEAAGIVAAARAAADRVVTEARDEVDAAVAAARRRALDAAAARAAATLARARREHHTAVLRAEAALRDEVAERVRQAVRALPGDRRYPALLDRLGELARRQLGDDATIERDPAPGRGLLAEAAGRTVDYRLDALAERAFAAIEEEVAASWS
jgi:hypothetical protein